MKRLFVVCLAAMGSALLSADPIVTPINASNVSDVFSCSVEFFGSVSRKSVLEVSSAMGAYRLPDPMSKTAMTYGSSTRFVRINDLDTGLLLWVVYQHAVKKGADGKPVKAVQKTCIEATASKLNPVPGDGTGPPPVGPIFNGCPFTSSDPFDPNDPDARNWEEVPLIGDIPALVLNKVQYFDVHGPNGGDTGVVKVACNSNAVVIHGHK